MEDIDKLIRRAKRLEILSRPYNRVSVIVCNAGGWMVKGRNGVFKSAGAAAEHCKDAAAGRDYSVIIDDIPRMQSEDMPEGYAVTHPAMLATQEVGLWHDSE